MFRGGVCCLLCWKRNLLHKRLPSPLFSSILSFIGRLLLEFQTIFLTVCLCCLCPLTAGFGLTHIPSLSVLTTVLFLIFSLYFPASPVTPTVVMLYASVHACIYTLEHLLYFLWVCIKWNSPMFRITFFLLLMELLLVITAKLQRMVITIWAWPLLRLASKVWW